MHSLPRFAILLFAGVTVGLPAAAAESTRDSLDWSLCRAFDMPTAPPPPADLAPDLTYLEADSIEASEQRWYHLSGDVRLWRNEQWLLADDALYDQATDRVQASGSMRIGQAGMSMAGSGGEFALDTQRGYVDNATYWLGERHARGTTKRITFDSPTHVRLKHAKFSTCPPDAEAWYIKAPRVTLDRDSGFGSATNAFLTFQHVPILYIPYVTFPIDDRRKSGFLFPSFGRSNSSGWELTTPYYLNLAPNYDATLSPRFMSRRGTLLDAELRYLTAKTDNVATIGHIENDRDYHDSRSSVSLKHTGQPLANLHTEVSAGYVSDDRYLRDLGNSLVASATSFVEQRAEASYALGRGTTTLRLQTFQTVDPDITAEGEPYRRLPQVLFDYGAPFAGAMEGRFRGEFVRFAHQELPSGDRLDLAPMLRAPYERASGFVTPKVTLRYTDYRTDGRDTTDERSLARTIPVTSLDTGIFLERDIRIGSGEYLHTLEPRLFFAYIPYRKQDDLPVYDTGLTDFSFAQLFRENRFTGADRVGDTQQVSVALSSRILDSYTGIERLRGSIGQIFYLKERRVWLPDNIADTRDHSDVVAEAALRLNQTLRSRAETIWNPNTNEVDRGNFRLQYQRDPTHVLNASYRWTRDTDSEQTDYSFIWPASRRWLAVGRWLYDHSEQRTVDSLAGLQYNSCCWNLRVLARRYFVAGDTPEGDRFNDSFMIQLELKGLSNLGASIEKTLQDAIPGFGDAYRSKP